MLSGLLPACYWVLRPDTPGNCTSKGQRRTGRAKSGGNGRFQQRKPGERSPRKGSARTGLFKDLRKDGGLIDKDGSEKAGEESRGRQGELQQVD